MRISDWSSDVCSSDLRNLLEGQEEAVGKAILDSGLIDEQRLFHALGLYLSERDEFVELYARIPTPDRPALTPFFDPRFYLESNPDVEDRKSTRLNSSH